MYREPQAVYLLCAYNDEIACDLINSKAIIRSLKGDSSEKN